MALPTDLTRRKRKYRENLRGEKKGEEENPSRTKREEEQSKPKILFPPKKKKGAKKRKGTSPIRHRNRPSNTKRIWQPGKRIAREQERGPGGSSKTNCLQEKKKKGNRAREYIKPRKRRKERVPLQNTAEKGEKKAGKIRR